MTARRPLVVVGDALLDRDLDGAAERLCPDAPVPVVDEPEERARPGGAGLAAALAAADGRRVTLVTALGRDRAGRELAGLLAECGVEVIDLGRRAPTPEKVRVQAGGRSLVRVDRGGRGPARVGRCPDAVRRALAGAGAVLVADYGGGVTSATDVRACLAAVRPRTPIVWDPHPRGTPPVPGTRLATPNRAEARVFAPDVEGEGLPADAARAGALLERWPVAGVAVTLGERGALLATGDGPPMVVPATPAVGGDVCGAGDRFAAAVATLLADGALPSEAVAGAVEAAAAFVAAGGAAGFAPGPPAPPAGATGSLDPVAVARGVRARGGTVVATGGCFDIVHPGHVGMLEAARSLGDCLIVCLNSDDSVRRLKGPGRPVMPEGDRAAVLLALGCVDAVAVFGEDTPLAVLERLRPDVFAKGGDYAGSDLPEAALLASWGGQAVVLPYLEGRSSSRIVSEVVSRVGE